MDNKHCQSTLELSGKQFFRDNPARKVGSANAICRQNLHTTSGHPRILTTCSLPPSTRESRQSTRWTAPTTHFSSDLQLDISLIAHNKTMPVRGRTALFSTNWVKLTLDQWVLATVQHSYQNINAVHVPHKGLQCQKGCLQFEVVNMVI